MALLFAVENGVAKPTTETLLIPVFKEIWDRDQTEEKDIALKEFSFIEFMTSKKKSNPYSGYDEELRYKTLVETYFQEGWEIDDEIEKAMATIVDMQKKGSATYSYYVSALVGASKMREFFLTFDINERNERNGNPVYKPGDITRALNDTDKVLQNLNSLKEKVEQELFELTKTRSNKTINPFEE